MKDQRDGIINAMNVITTPKMSEPIADHLIEVGLEKVSIESLSGIEGVSKTAAERVIAAIDLHNELSKSTARKTTVAKPSTIEKFKSNNSLEDRVEIGREVAELRINAQGSKPWAWRRIREKLGLKNDEFHKVVRVEDHYKESCVKRIESFVDGWEYTGKLDVLLGFHPEGELLDRIEACKPKPKAKPKPEKEDVKSDAKNEEETAQNEEETTDEVEEPQEQKAQNGKSEEEKPQDPEPQEEEKGEEEIPEPTEDDLMAIAAAMAVS